VVSHVTDTRDYEEVALIGFSLGGNLTLKHLGERGRALAPRIKKAVAFPFLAIFGVQFASAGRLTNQI